MLLSRFSINSSEQLLCIQQLVVAKNIQLKLPWIFQGGISLDTIQGQQGSSQWADQTAILKTEAAGSSPACSPLSGDTELVKESLDSTRERAVLKSSACLHIPLVYTYKTVQ